MVKHLFRHRLRNDTFGNHKSRRLINLKNYRDMPKTWNFRWNAGWCIQTALTISKWICFLSQLISSKIISQLLDGLTWVLKFISHFIKYLRAFPRRWNMRTINFVCWVLFHHYSNLATWSCSFWNSFGFPLLSESWTRITMCD